MARLDIDKFDKTASYTGYVWLSDQDKPTVIRDGQIDAALIADGVNPFIIEALLVSGEKSFSIRNINGRMRIDQYAVHHAEDETHTQVSYTAHRMEGVNTLSFYQEWNLVDDPLCDGKDDDKMKVLEPGALIFVGFDKFKVEKQ